MATNGADAGEIPSGPDTSDDIVCDAMRAAGVVATLLRRAGLRKAKFVIYLDGDHVTAAIDHSPVTIAKRAP